MKKQTYIFPILLLVILFSSNFSKAQSTEEKKELPQYLLLHMNFSFQQPGADMAKRFSRTLGLGLGMDYLTKKNFILGWKGDFIFGNNVKEDVLVNLRDSNGHIIGNNRGLSGVGLRTRGLHVSALFGKLIPFSKSAQRSGIRATIGVGFLQHKIRIQQDPQSFVPQTEGDYAKGYDRLTNGLSLTEFIGYQMVSKDKRINFLIGLEFVQGFTQNRRDWNFDTRMKDETKRLDLLMGVKLGWTLPFAINQDPEEIFY